MSAGRAGGRRNSIGQYFTARPQKNIVLAHHVAKHGIAQHPNLGGRFYVATEVGVFGTSDNCLTWSTSNDGPTDASVDEVNFLNNSSVLLAATHGRGLWTSAIYEPLVSTLGPGCPGSAPPGVSPGWFRARAGGRAGDNREWR